MFRIFSDFLIVVFPDLVVKDHCKVKGECCWLVHCVNEAVAICLHKETCMWMSLGFSKQIVINWGREVWKDCEEKVRKNKGLRKMKNRLIWRMPVNLRVCGRIPSVLVCECSKKKKKRLGKWTKL